jgi:hypothetical protein
MLLAGIYSVMSIGIDVVNVGVSNSSCFFIFNIYKEREREKTMALVMEMLDL